MTGWIVAIAALPVAQRAIGQAPMANAVTAEADSVAQTAGLPRTVPTDRAARGDLDVRAFIGFGEAAPSHLVHMERRAGRVTGELVLWWPGTALRGDVPDDPERPIAQHDQETWAAAMRQRVRAMGCGAVTQGGWVETCVIANSRGIDWANTLARLESAGVTTVRRNQNAHHTGGVVLLVQVRTGGRLSSFSYSDPQAGASDPGERAAARVMAALLRLF